MSRIALVVAMLVLGVGARDALAGQLFTGRMYRTASGGQGFRCSATNVGSKPIKSVTMEFFAGTVAFDTFSCTPLEVGATCEAIDANPPLGFNCRVTFSGSAKSLRANMTVYDTATTTIQALEVAR